VVDFTSGAQSGTSPFIVNFTNLTTGSQQSKLYLWDFGDGTTNLTEDLTPISKTYSNDGAYTVTLSVATETGAKTNTKAAYIVL